MKKFLLMVLVIFLVASTIWCQKSIVEIQNISKTSGLWISFGIGNNYFGPTLKSNFSYNYNNNLFSIRYFESEEFRFGVDDVSDDPSISLKEIGFLYGRTMRKDILTLGLAAGVGYGDGVLRGEQLGYQKYEAIQISNICIPIELNFRFELNKYFGIGGSVFSNINNKKSIAGFAVELYIGKFH